MSPWAGCLAAYAWALGERQNRTNSFGEISTSIMPVRLSIVAAARFMRCDRRKIHSAIRELLRAKYFATDRRLARYNAGRYKGQPKPPVLAILPQCGSLSEQVTAGGYERVQIGGPGEARLWWLRIQLQRYPVIWFSNATLAKRLRCSVRHVRRMLKALEDAGELSRIQSNGARVVHFYKEVHKSNANQWDKSGGGVTCPPEPQEFARLVSHVLPLVSHVPPDWCHTSSNTCTLAALGNTFRPSARTASVPQASCKFMRSTDRRKDEYVFEAGGRAEEMPIREATEGRVGQSVVSPPDARSAEKRLAQTQAVVSELTKPDLRGMGQRRESGSGPEFIGEMLRGERCR